MFDAREPYADGQLWLREGSPREGKPSNPRYRSFRWKHPRKSISVARCPVYLDLGEQLLLIRRRIGDTPPYGGWGLLVYRHGFVATTMSLLQEGEAAS